jgi:hypothetical protein
MAHLFFAKIGGTTLKLSGRLYDERPESQVNPALLKKGGAD